MGLQGLMNLKMETKIDEAEISCGVSEDEFMGDQVCKRAMEPDIGQLRRLRR